MGALRSALRWAKSRAPKRVADARKRADGPPSTVRQAILPTLLAIRYFPSRRQQQQNDRLVLVVQHGAARLRLRLRLAGRGRDRGGAAQRVVERLTCGQRAARIGAAGLRLAGATCIPLPSNIARSRSRVASDFPRSALTGEQGS
jgi:hypothetical protein